MPRSPPFTVTLLSVTSFTVAWKKFISPIKSATSRQLGRSYSSQPFQPHRGQHGFDLAAQLVAGKAGFSQSVGDIVEHVQVRKNRIGLEHHVGRPQVRRHAVHRYSVDGDDAMIGRLEARDHAQQCALAAARWPQQRKEHAAFDRQIDRIDHTRAAERLADLRYRQKAHHAPTIGFLTP
jgi:hypothetical protein